MQSPIVLCKVKELDFKRCKSKPGLSVSLYLEVMSYPKQALARLLWDRRLIKLILIRFTHVLKLLSNEGLTPPTTCKGVNKVYADEKP